jgi:hypothetical protein
MITLKTITTIELSSACNLACRYCVNRLIGKNSDRKPGIMSDRVFNAACDLLRVLCDRGTQNEVNLNGNGESCLDPKLPERIARVKQIVGSRPVCMSTNGVNMSVRLAKEIKAAGMDKIDLSPHSPFHARRAVFMLGDAGLYGSINMGAVTASHDWAGQLEPENTVGTRLNLECVPLKEGRGYIQSEGQISPCCYDYRDLGVFGTVFDGDIQTRPIRPYELCKTCHQKISDEVLTKVPMGETGDEEIRIAQ